MSRCRTTHPVRGTRLLFPNPAAALAVQLQARCPACRRTRRPSRCAACSRAAAAPPAPPRLDPRTPAVKRPAAWGGSSGCSRRQSGRASASGPRSAPLWTWRRRCLERTTAQARRWLAALRRRAAPPAAAALPMSHRSGTRCRPPAQEMRTWRRRRAATWPASSTTASPRPPPPAASTAAPARACQAGPPAATTLPPPRPSWRCWARDGAPARWGSTGWRAPPASCAVVQRAAWRAGPRLACSVGLAADAAPLLPGAQVHDTPGAAKQQPWGALGLPGRRSQGEQEDSDYDLNDSFLASEGAHKGGRAACAVSAAGVLWPQSLQHTSRARPHPTARSLLGGGGAGTEGLGATPRSALSHEDHCAACGSDAGELLLCDGCPSVYHLSCCGLAVVPEGAVCSALAAEPRAAQGRRDAGTKPRRHTTPPLLPPLVLQANGSAPFVQTSAHPACASAAGSSCGAPPQRLLLVRAACRAACRSSSSAAGWGRRRRAARRGRLQGAAPHRSTARSRTWAAGAMRMARPPLLCCDASPMLCIWFVLQNFARNLMGWQLLLVGKGGAEHSFHAVFPVQGLPPTAMVPAASTRARPATPLALVLLGCVRAGPGGAAQQRAR